MDWIQQSMERQWMWLRGNRNFETKILQYLVMSQILTGYLKFNLLAFLSINLLSRYWLEGKLKINVECQNSKTQCV